MDGPVNPSECTIVPTPGSAGSDFDGGSYISNFQVGSGSERQEGWASQSFLMVLDKIDALESRFGSVTDPSTPDIDRIAKETQLSFRDVHAWFHRKRLNRQKRRFESHSLDRGPTLQSHNPILATSRTINPTTLAYEVLDFQ